MPDIDIDKELAICEAAHWRSETNGKSVTC